MHLNGHSDEVSDGNEEQVIGNWMIGYWKSDPYYRMSEDLTESCSSISGEVDHESGEVEYLAEAISR